MRGRRKREGEEVDGVKEGGELGPKEEVGGWGGGEAR